MGLKFALYDHYKMLAWLVHLKNDLAWLKYVKAESFNKHFYASLVNILKALKLVLQVQDQALIFFVCSLDGIF